MVFVKTELFKGNIAGGKIPMAVIMGDFHRGQLPESIFALEKYPVVIVWGANFWVVISLGVIIQGQWRSS